MNDHVNLPAEDQGLDSHSLPSGSWNLDPDRTVVTVTAKKLVAFTIPATVTLLAGSIVIDGDHQVSGVEVAADASSYASANAKRNDHIHSNDFLDAENHPQLIFSAAQASPAADGYRASGSITVKGSVSPLDVDVSQIEFDAKTASFIATATIDRNAIGLGKLPSFVIGRNVELRVDAVASVQT